MPVFALEIPWGFQHPEVKYWKNKGCHVYKGPILPVALRPFYAKDFSLARWVEDESNSTVMPTMPGKTVFTPRPHQIEAAKAIFLAYSKGLPGFLIGDKTGTGKTLSTLAGVTAIAKSLANTNSERKKLLIVCPKGVIPVWRQTIRSYPASTKFLRPLIINYQQLNKLLEAPPNARLAKTASTKNRRTAKDGKPIIKWDYIIFDEAHYLKNYPSSATSMSAVSIAELNHPYQKDKSPFVVFSTATPGASPLNFAVMAPIVAPLINSSAQQIPPTKWGEFLYSNGFSVTKNKTGWAWISTPWYGKNSDDPKEKVKHEKALADCKRLQRRDALKIGKALTLPGAPFVMRSPTNIAGWPEQQLVPLPTELSGRAQEIYDTVWSRFRDWLRLTPAKKDPKGALVENLRYRQKASLLKVDQVIDTVTNLVETGSQVYVSCEFIETIDRYKELLQKAKISFTEYSGRNVDLRENERIRFQRGEVKVILCTVVEGISLHAEEILPDGTKASSNDRVTIVHDVRQNPLSTVQLLGRAHRDGKNSIAYIPYIENTVDETVINGFANKYANLKTMTGTSIEEADELETIFRAAAAQN